jgi:hypothetical protein
MKIKPNAYCNLSIIRALRILWIEFFDEDGWPHYSVKEELPTLKSGEQSVLMKEASSVILSKES